MFDEIGDVGTGFEKEKARTQYIDVEGDRKSVCGRRLGVVYEHETASRVRVEKAGAIAFNRVMRAFIEIALELFGADGTGPRLQKQVVAHRVARFSHVT